MDKYIVSEVNCDMLPSNDVIDYTNKVLSLQPDPKPYISVVDNSLLFNYAVLDVRILEHQVKSVNNIKFISDGMTHQIQESCLDLLTAIYEIVLHNKQYSLKSGKRVYLNINAERKVKNRQNKVENRNKHYYANDNSFDTKNVLLDDEYTNKIICGDSLHVLKQLPDNCIDLVFTSPPYNFGLDYSTNDDTVVWNEYFHKLFLIFDECIRVLKYGGRIVVNIQPLFSDYIPSHHIISNYFMSKRLIWKGEILWEKNNYNCKYTAWGSWKSPSNPYLKYTWEFIEVYAKGTLKKEGDQSNADISADEFKDWVVAKWSIAPERNMSKYAHPAMFPEELAKRVIKLFSFEGDVILDPFNGVGTTTLVSRKNNRRYIGIDISDQYCDMAVKRINEVLI